ncbi:MAG: 30S ribosomal protein S9 [Flavobacteriales bacterium]
METINAIGRRKKSRARVYLRKGKGNLTVNGKDHKEYFPTSSLQQVIHQPLKRTENEGNFDIKCRVDGGGISGQAEALRMAVSRALSEHNSENRDTLKPEGFLTRDPRMVERKKTGRRKARKKSQFSKR